MKRIITALLCSLIPTIASAGWDTPPDGWDDIKFGLVNDNAPYCNERIREAVVDRGIKVDYRYIYLNGGVDPASNRLSWSYSNPGVNDYTTKSKSTVGCEAAYVVYMLQEEGGTSALQATAQSTDKMKKFFESLRIVAELANGKKSTWVIEPDTWGYILQGNQSDTGRAVVNSMAHINDLGYAHLAGFDNKISNLPQAIIQHIKHYAPDAYAGILMSFWAVDANQKVDAQWRNNGVGLVEWTDTAVQYSARVSTAFANSLLPRTDYSKGDFIGVEKNGYCAGWWAVNGGKNFYYWDDTEMKKWLSWCETLAKGVDLPLLGWQISIGHMGLENKGTANDPSRVIGDGAYEDTFFPYFFAHPQEFTDIGFIGFLVGKGLADATDYTNSTSEPTKGDKGWFLDQLLQFDKGRPWLGAVGPRYSITASAVGGGTINPAGTVMVDSGKTKQFNFTANKWFVLDSVKVDNALVSVTGGTYSLADVTSNHTITAYFGKDPNAPSTWTITAEAGANGSITPSGSIVVEDGKDSSLVIAANSGYKVDSVLVDGVNYGPLVTARFTHLYEDHTVKSFYSKGGVTSQYAAWNSSTAYEGNAIVSYNGHLWKAQWWTQGNTPGTDGVWVDQGVDTSGGDDSLVIADLDYRSAVTGADTLIITTKVIRGTDTTTTTKTVYSGSTAVNQPLKSAGISAIRIGQNGINFTVPQAGTYQATIRNVQGRVIATRSYQAGTSGVVTTGIDMNRFGRGVVVFTVESGTLSASQLITIQ